VLNVEFAITKLPSLLSPQAQTACIWFTKLSYASNRQKIAYDCRWSPANTEKVKTVYDSRLPNPDGAVYFIAKLWAVYSHNLA